jgi:hypothetical protein
VYRARVFTDPSQTQLSYNTAGPPPTAEVLTDRRHSRSVPTPDIALAACRRSVVRRGQRGRYAELGSVRLLKDELEACGAKRK